MEKQKITGIILAGGKSRRMGTEKGLIEFRGKSLICYALEALQPLCSEILISANSSFYNFLGYPVIPDEFPESGPMGGIYSCLKKSKNEFNFVLSCDMPLVDSAVVWAIKEHATNCDIAVPWHEDDYSEPLCAVYKKSSLPGFEKFLLAGDYKILNFINASNSKKLKTVKGTILDPKLFYNVNSKKHLEELENKIAAKTPSTIEGLPNLLMIAGTGRKVGKTTLACKLIEKISSKQMVTGIKISPHFHYQAERQKVLAQSADYLIMEEINPDTEKDSSRMLRSGASKVYYLQTADRHIEEPFRILLDLIPKNQAIVCESGALLNNAKPGLFILVKRIGQTAYKKGLANLPYFPDRWVTFDGEGFDLDFEKVQFNETGWNL